MGESEGVRNRKHSRKYKTEIQQNDSVYNPILGTMKEDEGIDPKELMKSSTLKSQSYTSTFRFFFKQSFKDARRHKCQYCLGFCSVFVVVLMTLIINTLIDSGPIIFLRLAEGSVGEIDGLIESSSNTDDNLIKYVNYTQMVSLYGDRYNLSPRKLQEEAQYAIPYRFPTDFDSNGLPSITDMTYAFFTSSQTQDIRVIDTEQEDKIECGQDYEFSKLGLGECIISQELADLHGLTRGSYVYMRFDVNKELYILYEHYLIREDDKTGYEPSMGTVIAPCRVVNIHTSLGGKFPTSVEDSTIIMEYEYFYTWISAYVQPSDNNASMVAFRQFLLGAFARPEDLASFVIMTFPDPRIDFYKESDYDDVQRNVVSYVNGLVDDLGFFPESIR